MAGKSKSTSVFALPAALTIGTVEGLLAELQKLKLKTSPLQLNAAATEVLTTPGAQLLVALTKTLEARGMELVVTGLKPALMAVFEQLGLTSFSHNWELAND